jgi:hypothetical protein
MTTLYEIGALLVIRDPYDYMEVVCVVMGIATVNVYGNEDAVLYHGYSLTHNSQYYFFGSDIICRIEDY